MTVKLVAKILDCDVPNKNGHIYSTETAKSIIEKAGNRPLFGRIGMAPGDSIVLEDVSHQISNLRIKDGQLIADIEVLQTPQGKVLESLMVKEDGTPRDINVDFRVSGWGNIDAEGTITDFILREISAVNDGA